MNKLQGLTLETAIYTLCFSGSNVEDRSDINLSHPRRAFRVLYAVLLTSSLASCFVAFKAVARTSSPSASVPCGEPLEFKRVKH